MRKPIILKTSELELQVFDNDALPGHYRGYNGIVRMVHTEQNKSVFRECFAGLNFEAFLMDGVTRHVERIHAMEPRYAYTDPIERLSDNTARFHQPPTPLHKLETTILYTAVEPHYLDLEVTYKVHHNIKNKSGFSAWWASYMNAPEDPCLYIIGHTEKVSKTRWLRLQREGHGQEPILASDMNDTKDPATEAYHWDYPFYVGFMYDYTYIVLFDDLKLNQIAYSPTGGDNYPVPMPAWDFVHIINNCIPGKDYRFRCRMVYTKFAGLEQVIREYEQWSGKKVEGL